ncbi:MAG: glycerol kinase GlpK, partial [bacterium]
CILFNKKGEIRSVAQQEFTQYYPKPGWVEHDPDEILGTMLSVSREALANVGASASDIAAIGITNQRETTIVWNKTTGRPICNAIVWQCRRTAPMANQLIEEGYADAIREKTGLRIDPYFSATKIAWILDNVPGARAMAEAGELLFGTVDTWLIWNMTDGLAHVTDVSNASRTMLYNIRKLCWDEEILERLRIPASMLPEVRMSSEIYGKCSPQLFGARIPIAGAAGDQQSALFGQNCFQKGDAKNTYGTGCFLLANAGSEVPVSYHGLLTTIAWGIDGKVTYALEGSVFVGGAAIQWLRDEMGLVKSAAETEYVARSVPDTNGCYVVPAFTGLGAPYWDSYARGVIVGLTRGVGRAHIVRATLESLAYQVNDVLESMSSDIGTRFTSLRVDGGASANNLLMEMQANISGLSVERPVCLETTALGAAYFAGLAVGFWKDFDELRANAAGGRTFIPRIEKEEREEKIAGWHRAVERSFKWA